MEAPFHTKQDPKKEQKSTISKEEEVDAQEESIHAPFHKSVAIVLSTIVWRASTAAVPMDIR